MNKCTCGNFKDEKYLMCLDCYNNKVESENINNWLKSLKENWINKNINNIVSLFCVDCECYDTPFSKNGNLRADWLEIKEQIILDIQYKILMRNKYEFIVEFTIQYENEICSAINHIKLNDALKCFYLKQWYMCK